MVQLSNAVNALAATLQKLASVAGSYSRVNGSTAEIRGTLVTRDYEIIDDDGVLTMLKSADWLFQTGDLEGLMPPQPGDEWVVDDFQSGQPATYHAMLLGKRPCFDAHDSTEVLTVVHMKKVANA